MADGTTEMKIVLLLIALAVGQHLTAADVSVLRAPVWNFTGTGTGQAQTGSTEHPPDLLSSNVTLTQLQESDSTAYTVTPRNKQGVSSPTFKVTLKERHHQGKGGISTGRMWTGLSYGLLPLLILLPSCLCLLLIRRTFQRKNTVDHKRNEHLLCIDTNPKEHGNGPGSLPVEGEGLSGSFMTSSLTEVSSCMGSMNDTWHSEYNQSVSLEDVQHLRVVMSRGDQWNRTCSPQDEEEHVCESFLSSSLSEVSSSMCSMDLAWHSECSQSVSLEDGLATCFSELLCLPEVRGLLSQELLLLLSPRPHRERRSPSGDSQPGSDVRPADYVTPSCDTGCVPMIHCATQARLAMDALETPV